jgi:MFS family permease
MPHRPRRILPAIIVSQFAGASIWLAGNAVMHDLQQRWGLPVEAVGYVTSAVQLGFISGTLVFALLALADRHSPRRVFLACALLGALANLGIVFAGQGLAALLALRFATGFFLAGIYPVGMKIAAGWYRDDLGSALGFLVGALVLGTAFPHLLKALGAAWPWQGVMLGASAIAAGGGLVMFALVPDGPHLVHGARFDPSALVRIFRSPGFRSSVFGYFGHMWELYAFWAFVPVALAAHGMRSGVALWAFIVIAAGFAGCAVGGIASLRWGSARVAAVQLAASGACCLASPLLYVAPEWLFLAFLVFWGVVVVGDSPQFSALNAAYAPRERVGSALTIGNSIGFAITIASIQLLAAALAWLPVQYLFLLLAPGPALGLLALRPLLGARSAET